MKVSEMNKADLLDHMKASREILTYNDTPAWRRAFILARQNGLENIEPGCIKCIIKVKEWLERP
jgi:hypothetical protein